MSHFFAFMSRMRYITRWGLMRNTQPENIQEHSLQAAMIAHVLALVGNRFFGRQYDPERIMALAVYHEASEVITGDLATPIKYFSPDIRDAYKRIEHAAAHRLLAMIPQELQADYEPLLLQRQDENYRIVKAADRICAYLKCEEELKGGNGEFLQARNSILKDIEASSLPEVAYFMEHFAPSFQLTLDEMK
jgi:5'-deoxynucleotidase